MIESTNAGICGRTPDDLEAIIGEIGRCELELRPAGRDLWREPIIVRTKDDVPEAIARAFLFLRQHCLMNDPIFVIVRRVRSGHPYQPCGDGYTWK